jgi:hypothetical protein
MKNKILKVQQHDFFRPPASSKWVIWFVGGEDYCYTRTHEGADWILDD